MKLETMDGITATKHIHGEFPNSKIVVVSSYSDAQFRAAAEKAGAIGYVLKDNLRDVIGILQQPVM
ncbi:MAG: response regulator transcription factor [Bacteroidetes bacterium]|nr:MAG: response regulator transcription factor [Bacteroidota bacterium]